MLFPFECIGKRQAPPALRVRRQGLRRHHDRPRQGRPVLTHAKALPGNPDDGHTLATEIPDMEELVGNTIGRILADKRYRGHNAPPSSVFIPARSEA
jgi:IS5 family transposase